MHEAKVAPTKALIETSIKSFVRSGAIAPMPEINIPTLEKFAKPHKLTKCKVPLEAMSLFAPGCRRQLSIYD